MKKILLFTLICMEVLLSACGTGTAPSDENSVVFQEGYTLYRDGISGFSVTFPATWASETMPYRYPSETENGSPDSGVTLYVEGDNSVYIYGSHGKITTRYVEESDFQREELDGGNLLYTKETGEITEAQWFPKNNGHISAVIKMESTIFQKHKEELLKVLESIVF